MNEELEVERMGDAGPLKMQSGMANETKLDILDEPMLLTFLFGSESRRVLLEWFIGLAEDEKNYDSFSKTEIHRETGLSRKTVGEHIDILHKMGLIETEGDKRVRYRIPIPFNRSTPLYQLMEFNDSLADHTNFEELTETLRDYS